MHWATRLLAALSLALIGVGDLRAEDLRSTLDNVFSEVLELQLAGPQGSEHGSHFRPANVAASGRIIDALGNFISANASSYPLSSATSGVVFDFSSGVPVAISTSAGPIFAQQARTLGSKTFSLGSTISHLNLAKVRGVRTEDIQFSFTHEDVGAEGLGDSPNEYDVINLMMDMDLSATVAAFHATYGLTDRIDLGIAVPFVSVSLTGDPIARMDSYTYASTGTANHYFEGGTPESPILTFRPTPLDASASGIGDITLRAKFHALAWTRGDLAFLAEAALPTGKEEDFLGAGSASYKAMVITSGQWGALNTHLNLAYDRRTSDFERDEFEITAGYDQKATETITVIVEWNAEFDLGDEIEELKFPEVTPVGVYTADNGKQYASKYVNPSNIPGRSNDNMVNSAIGLKYSPKPSVVLLANIIVPLNDGGLRSSFIPTVGLSLSL